MSRTAWIVLATVSVSIFVSVIVLVFVPSPNDATRKSFLSKNVKVFLPPVGGSVRNEFTAVGEARGTWFFEASFPVQVRDSTNNLIGRGIAQAGGEWMTADFVPFTAQVTVENYSGPAELVFLKDNPSGLPENSDSVSIPIEVLDVQ